MDKKKIFILTALSLFALGLNNKTNAAEIQKLYLGADNVYYNCEGKPTTSQTDDNRDSDITNLDLASVKILNENFFTDKNNVYFVGTFNYYCYFYTLEGADPNTFEILSKLYEKDKNYAYYNTYYHGGPGVHKIDGSDGATFTELKGGYAKDKNAIYHLTNDGVMGTLIKIADADPATFEIFSDYPTYAKDKSNFYYAGKDIAGADMNTFKILGSGFSKDLSNVYYLNEIFPGADSSTFENIDNYYFKDKSNVYFVNKLIKMADLKTFTAMKEEPGYAIDKNNIYSGGQILQMSGLVIRNDSLYNSLKGKIVLKVAGKGEAFYISPVQKIMHYLSSPAIAFYVLRKQGVGITNMNLEKIPVGGSCPSYDRNCDVRSYDLKFAYSQKGKIFLQVQGNGEAWYVNPKDTKRYFLGRPADAFNIMRTLGLGISNADYGLLIK